MLEETTRWKTLDEVLKEHVLRTVEHCDGHKSKAAKLLAIDRKTVRLWLRARTRGNRCA